MKKLVFVFGLLVLTGCGHTLENPNDIIIGGIMPITGKAHQYGTSLQKIINLRIEQINNHEGVNGKNMKIIWRDGKCDYEVGQEVARDLINNEKVKVIIGGACSDETLGAALVSNPAQVVLISPLATTPALTSAGDYVFRTIASSQTQGELLGQYADYMNYDKIGLFWESNRYTDPIDGAFREYYDGEYVQEMIGDDNADINRIIARFREAKVPAIFLNTYSPDTVERVLIEIKKQKWEVPVLGNSVAVNSFKSLIKKDSDYRSQIFVSGYFAVDQEQDEFQEFARAFEARYASPMKFPDFAASTLDAVDVLYEALLVVKNDKNNEALRDYLYTIQHIGFSGGMNFDSNGDTTIPNKLTIFNGEEFVEFRR